MLAYAKSYGNADGRIAFQYISGETDHAIAGNDVNSSEILVLWDEEDNRYYAFSDTSNSVSLEHEEGVADDPIFPEPDEPPTILPFQVLFKPTVQLGGDRNQIGLSSFENTLIGGINNLGEEQYLAVWLQDEIIRDNNGGQSFLGFPGVYNFFDPEWIGNGLLAVLADTPFPEPDLTTEQQPFPDPNLTPEEQAAQPSEPLIILIPVLDEEGNQAVDEDGVPVPPIVRSFVPPRYPDPIPLFVSSLRKGATITSQVTSNYNYLGTEVYNFLHSISGDSTVPLALFPGAICGFGVPATTIFFNRETGMDYLRVVNEELNGFSEVYLNNQVFSGERTQTYTETFLYDQTDSSDLVLVGVKEVEVDGQIELQDVYTDVVILYYLMDGTPVYAPKFSTQSFFRCIEFAPTIYAWTPAITRSGRFRGEKHTTDRDYERKIIEPEWLAPITLFFGREKKHFRTEIGTEDNELPIIVTEWEINPFEVGFTFPIVCVETKLETVKTDEDLRFPKTRLISGDGLAALFTERTYLLDRYFTIEADTEFTRYNDIETYDLNPYFTTEDIENGEGEVIGSNEIENQAFKNIETTIVTTEEESNKFYLVIGDELTEIDTDSSWLFSVVTDQELNLGIVTLSNDDETPIFKGATNIITSYTKVRDVVQESLYENSQTLGNPNSTVFSDVTEEDVLFWDTVDQESVYIQTGGFRYRGLILEYDFVDAPTEDFPIETTRTVNSITIQIQSVEVYPQGLADPGEILIYPDDNCSVLLRDRILNSANKRYCNLVGNTLYFAKSVEFDFTAPTQFTEVYVIGLTVTQETPESGGFVPLNGAELALGISYFPAA